jgi:hypothetical protein
MLRKHNARGTLAALVAAGCAWLVTFQGCGSAYPSPSQEAPSSGQSASASNAPWMPRQRMQTNAAAAPTPSAAGSSAPAHGDDDDDDAGVRVDVDTRARAGATAAADAGSAGTVSTGTGAAGMGGAAGAAGSDAAPPTEVCGADVLQARLQAYLDAMASGDPQSLSVHPSVHYTENGEAQRLGSGVWTSRPEALFARSALDTQQCGSVTEAVLTDRFGAQIIFGLRLRYAEALLIDVEAMVVRRDPNLFAPEAIVVSGPDPWLMPTPSEKRMSRDALLAVAEAFFQSIVVPDVAPPHATGCMLRQNGVEVGGGDCAPGRNAERFEQLRYPVIDETTGLVGAVGLGHNLLVMFVIKIEDGTLLNIDSVGGHATSSSGW